MKHVAIGIMLFLSTYGVQAQAINNVPKPELVAQETKTPKFKFKTDTHDFGNIPEGPSVTYVFEFKNVGKAPLIINNASASCGCTSPEWPKEPIKPGKKGQIKVTFLTAGRGGQPFFKDVYISSNVPTENNAPIQLHIKGFVTAASNVPADNKVRK
ncbi:MAG TPA: DUF1573 domain-containing protein [Flavipsychrobacter sp.]|jgi:hypothetical protein|nr:DUF1573 domain-containing protein [Flavipsychrobacter sp.]